jgi:hypothetical protein
LKISSFFMKNGWVSHKSLTFTKKAYIHKKAVII